MKLSKVLAAVSMGLTLLPWAAHAQCSGNQVTGNGNNAGSLRTLLQGNTVCGRPAAGYPGNVNDRWQEEHLAAGGALWDYKLGNGPSIDPRKQVGTWTIGGQAGAVITHAYQGGSSFGWTVFGPGTNNPGVSVYSFCSGSVEFARAYVISGTNVGCGGQYP